MQSLTRRDFLKLSGLSLAGLALPPLPGQLSAPLESPTLRGRVTIDFINIYKEPNLRAERIGRLKRDTLIHIFEEIFPEDAPQHNPRWYRLKRGFVYSAYVQRVEQAHLNALLPEIPTGGQLGEITVPFTQSLRRSRSGDWSKLYRLYYGAVFWITSIEEGPDGRPWYGLTDDLLRVQYCVPASHVRPIHASELAPISPDVPHKDKRIQISLKDQTLTAYEGQTVVMQAKVSTGIPNPNLPEWEIPTHTPAGSWRISVKTPSRHMGDGQLTSDINAYELPGVPWVSFFHETGVAIHGTYWHDNFGRMMSHGCVNMRNEDARWIYRWTFPSAEHTDWIRKGSGTPVAVV
jgi:hypothetical protein